MSDEKSQAQQDKESRVKKIEDDLKKVYTDLFDKHQKAAESARADDKSNEPETEEEYRERIKNVPGLFSDSYAYGVNQEQTDELKDEADDASAEKDSDSDSDGDDSNAGENLATDPGVAKAASNVSPASDATKPATALENQKTNDTKKQI